MAGQSMRDIRRRIRSVKNTQQITRAMEMVAAAKLRRAQQQLTAGLPFASKLRDILALVVEHGVQRDELRTLHPLLKVPSETKRVCYVVVTADRGLAGGYNANVLRLAMQTIDEDERDKSILVIGRKGREFLLRRNYELYQIGENQDYLYIGDELDYDEARLLTKIVTDGFVKDEFDEIVLIHNHFLSTVAFEPTITRLLPIEADDLASENENAADDSGKEALTDEEKPGANLGLDDEVFKPIYEPDAKTVINMLIPRYIETRVYSLLLSAKASEQAARMIAMQNATENAEEMIEELTLSFNRARQNSITTELSEIVGGANALAGGE